MLLQTGLNSATIIWPHTLTPFKSKNTFKKKQIIDNKPNTRYVITALGKKVFGEHITALEGLLRQLK